MGSYYNEFDPAAAAWLRELIKRGLIADGEVDERSILDVSADDVRGFTQCHFFAGIGGWSYALRLSGWPDDRQVWTGSPPCQPFSSAGKQLGKDDGRHLAPHFISLVAAARPAMLFGEQVASSAVFGGSAKPTKRDLVASPEWSWIDDLSDRLEAAHYAVGALDIPAAFVGAPHIRQRTFFGAVRLADPHDPRPQGREWSGTAGAQGGSCGHGSECGGACGMADTPDFGRVQTGSSIASEKCDGVAGNGNFERMADASCAGSHASPFGGIHSGEDGSGSRYGEPERPCPTIGMADATRCGRGEERQDSGRGPVGDSSKGRTSGYSAGGRDSGPDAPNNPWRDADWLFCRDGKWRPVKCGLKPLVDGLPKGMGRGRNDGGPFHPAEARVMRLRGYGNAIVPQAAALFIKTFTEAAGEIGL